MKIPGWAKTLLWIILALIIGVILKVNVSLTSDGISISQKLVK